MLFEEMFYRKNHVLMQKDAKKVFAEFDTAHRSLERPSNMWGEGLQGR